MNVKVRFAPSPTGFLHVGGFRTALFNYLYIKKMGGKIVLRIEDTDQSRKVLNAVENLLSNFELLNIHFDEGPVQGGEYGPYYQSQRLHIYRKFIEILLKNGTAYPCFCSSEKLNKIRKKQISSKVTIKYDRFCLKLNSKETLTKMKTEPYIIRMKIPDGKEIIFHDEVRGRVTIDYNEIDDQVLIKSDGFPTYHFANVVDDHLMGITHVMRGEEWLSSTPKHILLYHFFEWKLPKFIHLPLLLNPDKSKLSKRQGGVSVEDYLNNGYLPEALLNFVSLLGWHPKNEHEIFSLSELEKEFSLKHLHKSGAIFDIEKLNWMNSYYLKNLPIKVVMDYVRPFFEKSGFDITDTNKFKAVVENARKRVNKISEIVDHSMPFYADLNFKEDDILFLKTDTSQKVLKYISKQLSCKKKWSVEKVNSLVSETSKIINIKGRSLYSPIRLSLFGSPHGPDIPQLIEILGVNESLHRLKRHL